MSSGILGTRATLVADINLLVQIALFFILVTAAWQGRNRRYEAHLRLMRVAVIINAVAIIAVMNPSFFRVLPFAARNPGAPGPTAMWPHVALGAIAELMGAYVVIRLGVDPRSAPRLRGVMLLTLVLWLAALLAGSAVYWIWYVR
jgi:uncharacterized membrane protein YozB (DUF420 family)